MLATYVCIILNIHGTYRQANLFVNAHLNIPTLRFESIPTQFQMFALYRSRSMQIGPQFQQLTRPSRAIKCANLTISTERVSSGPRLISHRLFEDD